MPSKRIRIFSKAHILRERRIYCTTKIGRERIYSDENDSMARPRVFSSATPKTLWKTQTEKEKRIKEKEKERKRMRVILNGEHTFACVSLPIYLSKNIY